MELNFKANDFLYRDGRIGNFVADIKCNGKLKAKLVLLDSGRYCAKGYYGSLTKAQTSYIKDRLSEVKCPILTFFHILLEEHTNLYETHLVDGTRRAADCYQRE